MQSHSEVKEDKSAGLQQVIENVLQARRDEINKWTDELSEVVADQLDIPVKFVQTSEIFESSLLKFVYKLDADNVKFLENNTDAKGQASYESDATTVIFKYEALTQEQIIKIAETLEKYFKNIKTEVMRNSKIDERLYLLKCNRDVFLKDVIPQMFSENAIELAPLESPKKPIVHAPVSAHMKRFAVFKSRPNFSVKKSEETEIPKKAI